MYGSLPEGNDSEMRKIYLTVVFLCILSVLTGCAGKTRETASKEGFYFDTVIQLSVPEDHEELLDGAFAICEELEETFSRTLEGSELYQINHRTGPEVTLSDDMRTVIETGLQFYRLTDGALDITIAPVLELWDFKSDDPQVPDADELAEAVKKVDAGSLSLEGNVLRFEREDTQIDLGALAKGFAADKLKEYFEENGVDSALINLGGNVMAVGSKPDGTPWKIGIQDPHKERGEVARVIEVTDRSVVSSGTYERSFEKDGVLYHHLLDPATGYPKEVEAAQVTIISDSSLLGDALSTSCLLIGEEAGTELASEFDNVEIQYEE